MDKTPPTGNRRLPAVAGLLAFVFLSAFFQVSDVDVGYHLRTAAHILGGNGIPATNTFSSATPEQPWFLQQWLGTLFYYWAFAAGGVGPLITFKALVAVLLMFFVWRRARAEAGAESWWPFWVVTVGVVATRMRFFERPDFLSALLFALVRDLDGRWGTNRRWQWLGLPLLMAFWGNVHSGIIYGVVLLGAICGADWIEWFWNRWARKSETNSGSATLRTLLVRPLGLLLSVAAACLAVQAINPNGCRVLWVPISQFTSPFWQAVIDEYHPPTWAGAKVFWLFLAGLVVLQALTLKRLNLRLLLVSATFGFLACRSQRSILFFIIAAAPHAARMLELLLPRSGRTVPGESMLVRANDSSAPLPKTAAPVAAGVPAAMWQRLQPVLLPVVWLLVVWFVFVPDKTFRFGVGWYRRYYPLEIYQFIKTEVPPQNIFNEMRYGGSMLWWLYPRFRPFIDGRGDAYTVQFWEEQYLPAVAAKPVWPETFARYNIHGVLLPLVERGKAPALARTLFDSPQWALVAYNDDTVFFLERTETNRQVIAGHEFKLLWPGRWSFDALDAPATHAAAAAEATRAFGSAPDSLFARTAMARADLTEGKFAEAADLLHRIVGEADAGDAYWRDYGYALFRLGRLDEADEVFDRMIRKQQMAGFANYMRHAIAVARGRPAEASQFLRRALEIEPTNSEYRGALERLEPAGRRP